MSNENEEIRDYSLLCGWCKYLVNTESEECVFEVEDGLKFYYCDKRCREIADCKGNYWEEDEDDEDSGFRLCGWCETEFHTTDTHYYDEEEGVCYCNEECFKKFSE